MDDATIDSKLSGLQSRHSDLIAEQHRVEGEFRAWQEIKNLLGDQKANEPEKDVDAPTQPEE